MDMTAQAWPEWYDGRHMTMTASVRLTGMYPSCWVSRIRTSSGLCFTSCTGRRNSLPLKSRTAATKTNRNYEKGIVYGENHQH